MLRQETKRRRKRQTQRQRHRVRGGKDKDGGKRLVSRYFEPGQPRRIIPGLKEEEEQEEKEERDSGLHG